METVTLEEVSIGVWFEEARGHYMGRDVIELAVGWGFIIGPFEQFAVSRYATDNSAEDYPNEAMTELCDEAVNWLNSGHDKCMYCEGGYVDQTKWTEASGWDGKIPANVWIDQENKWRCKYCTGYGRAPRIEGQNFPPIIPEGTQWAFEDGEFGLWRYDEEGVVTD